MAKAAREIHGMFFNHFLIFKYWRSAVGKRLTVNKNRNIIAKNEHKCMYMFHKDETYNDRSY